MSSTGSQPQPGSPAPQQWAAPEGEPSAPAAQQSAVQEWPQQQTPQQTQQQWSPQPGGTPSRWTRIKRRIFSDLNLNGQTPPRVQPKIGEWGPERVPTTKEKKRMRIYVGIALPVAMLACFLLGWYVYFMMTGCYGFGLGCRGQ